MTARLQRSAGVHRYPCGVGQATRSEGGLGIASNLGLEGDRETDLCGTARLGGQVCSLEVWLQCPNTELRRRMIGSRILRPRPSARPVKQLQECITEKTPLLQHACLLQKITWCKKHQKSDYQ